MKLFRLEVLYICFLATFSGVIAPTVASAEDVCEGSLEEIIAAKDFGLAYYCSELILLDDPENVTAMLVAARAAQELGQLDLAIELARRSREFRLTQNQRFASYLISGVATAGTGQALQSKILLRRAANVAQNDLEIQIVGAAMAQVRAQSPWSYGLSFNVTPSSNVNGGTIIDNPLDDEESRAQPGIGYSLNANVTHRTRVSDRILWENRTYTDSTFFDGLGQNNYTVGYSSSLRYQPESRLPLLLVASLAFENRGLADELGGDVFGDYAPYYSQSSFRLEGHFAPIPDHLVTISGGYTAREYTTRGDAEISQVGLSYGFPINSNISMSLSGFYENTDSANPFVAKETSNVAIGVLVDFDNFPVSFSGRLSHSINHYPLPILFVGFRDDESVSVDLGVTPKNLQWFGFRPTFGASFSENISTIDRFTTSELKLYTRISSVF